MIYCAAWTTRSRLRLFCRLDGLPIIDERNSSDAIDDDQVSARLFPNTALAYDGLVVEVQE
jgi:hypothetical protein